MYEKIKRWYRKGLWSAAMVQDAVEKGALSREEADKIIEGGGNNV